MDIHFIRLSLLISIFIRLYKFNPTNTTSSNRDNNAILHILKSIALRVYILDESKKGKI